VRAARIGCKSMALGQRVAVVRNGEDKKKRRRKRRKTQTRFFSSPHGIALGWGVLAAVDAWLEAGGEEHAFESNHTCMMPWGMDGTEFVRPCHVRVGR